MILQLLPFSFLDSKVLIFWYIIKCLYVLRLLFIIYLFLWNVNVKRTGKFVLFTDKSHMPVEDLIYSRQSEISVQLNWSWNWDTVQHSLPWYLNPLIFKAFLGCGLGPLVPACWYSPWRLPCALLPTAVTLIRCSYTAPPRHGDRAHGQAQATQLRCETLDLAADTWQPDTVSCPQVFPGISKHSWVCHMTTLNFPEHELFHLTWLGRQWASPGALLTISCFSLEQIFSHAHVFGPALPGEVGIKVGPVASRDRSGPQIQALCQTEGKRTTDYHWGHRRTEDQMGEWICPTCYGKTVANSSYSFTALPLGCKVSSPTVTPSNRAVTPALHEYAQA